MIHTIYEKNHCYLLCNKIEVGDEAIHLEN